MKRYLIFAAASAAFLAPASNADAKPRLERYRAASATEAFTRFVGLERRTGEIFWLRRCGPRCFHARVRWLAGTDEYSNTDTGEHWKRNVYWRETVTIKLRLGYAVVWSPFFLGWYVRGMAS